MIEKIKYQGIIYEVLISSSKASIRPQNSPLQDCIDEMMRDIGIFDIDYLKELISLNSNGMYSVSTLNRY